MRKFLSRSALAVSVVVACLLGFTRFGRAVAGRLRGPWWLRAVLLVLVVIVIGRLATLPFGVALQHQELRYRLSREGWGGYAVDQALGLAVSFVATAVAVVVLLAIVRRWRRTWPLIAGAVLAALVVLGSFVYPVVVEPLFNHFTPMKAGPLRSDVFRLAEQEHVHIDDVLVADASRRTTTLNAYVSGFGSTRRVVVYDTLLDGLPQPQIEMIVAQV